MEILFLGTGHAISTRCYNTCYVLRQNERYLLVDGGGGNGILRQLKRARLPWQKIKDIFVTHRHMDHVLGIFWVIRMIVKAMKRGTYVGEARIYGHDEVITLLRSTARLLLDRGVLLDCRIVPGGEHCEASWERQIPFFLNTLLYEWA